MSFANSSFPIQKLVTNYGVLSNPEEVINYFRAVSAANTSIQIDDNSFIRGEGKRRKLRINYFPVRCDDTGSCDIDVCTMEGEKIELAQRDYDITQCVATRPYTLEKDDLRLVDGNWSYSQTFVQMLNSVLPNFRRQISKAFVARAYALAGVHPDGSETKRMQSINTATGIVSPMGIYGVEKEYTDIGLSTPRILAGDEAFYLQKMVGIGGLNSDGQNINSVPISNIYYDEGVTMSVLNDAANGGWALSIDPQVFKMVTYSNNSGIFTTGMASINDIDKLYFNSFIGGIIEGAFADPVTGLIFDLYIRYDCGKWHVQIKLVWDFITMPDMVCSVQGMNGIMKWRSCPTVVVPCPEGSPISSPAAASAYTWTPTLANTPTISNITIGGVMWSSNDPVSIATAQDMADVLNEAYSPNETLFTVTGSPATTITYTGFTALTGTINGTVPITFS